MVIFCHDCNSEHACTVQLVIFVNICIKLALTCVHNFHYLWLVNFVIFSKDNTDILFYGNITWQDFYPILNKLMVYCSSQQKKTWQAARCNVTYGCHRDAIEKKNFFFGHPHWQHKSFHLCSELMSQLTLLFTNFQLVFKCPREVQCLRQYKHHCLMQVDVWKLRHGLKSTVLPLNVVSKSSCKWCGCTYLS